MRYGAQCDHSLHCQCLNLSLGGSRSIRAIVGGDMAIRVSALIVVGGGGVFGISPLRSVLGGRRVLWVGREWAGRNDRVVVTLGGGRAGRGGRTVLRDTVVLRVAVRGLWGRNGPISAGRGGRWRRGGRVVVVIRSRTTGIGPAGSLGRGGRTVGGSHFITSVPLDMVIGNSWIRSLVGRDFAIIVFGGLREGRDTRAGSIGRRGERLLRVRIGVRDRDVSRVVAIVGWN